MSKIVRTVRGDVAPSELGPTDAHEHLFFVTPIQPGDHYDDVERAIRLITLALVMTLDPLAVLLTIAATTRRPVAPTQQTWLVK